MKIAIPVLAIYVLALTRIASAEQNCTDSATSEAILDHHSIYIDRKGRLVDEARVIEKQQGARKSTYQVEKAYAQRIIAHFDAERLKNPQLELTIVIHGGLNRFENSKCRAVRLAPHMLEDGQYAVFIGWNSGPFTNYNDHLFRTRKGEHTLSQAIPTSPLVLLEDIIRSLVHIPEAWYRQIRDPIVVSRKFYADVERDSKRRREKLDQIGFNVKDEEPDTGVGGTYWSILNPVQFLTAPLVDGFGSGAWDAMLRRTDLVLSKPEAFEGRIPVTKPEEIDKSNRGNGYAAQMPAEPSDDEFYADTAATTFLALFHTRHQCSSQPGECVKINLIGHSMGTIVANAILARHPRLNVHNVVFMGAAARIKDMENVLVPWMRQGGHDEARFYNLSIDPYREISENGYYDFIPRGSLLHWIDNIFGEINSFKDRTSGSWWNITRTAADVFPRDGDDGKQLRRRVYLTRFPIGGDEKGPQTHGEFDDYCFWRTDFWTAAGPFAKFPDCAATAAIQPVPAEPTLDSLFDTPRKRR
ncbi:hypothetical protein IP92_01458 [Pseudoduganella flava]|uniref:Alpha/beta hydrolase n=1 Tax=Pseudoduganella flava TaxID=871742 RepID=A0A562Q0M8_9BURK|nr:alpha/beta hydrolase [Pseudoduganella flava]QGZ38239.1 hypothetical protein GO485_03690 [Pseudoduganella flava]TWI50229.1 hypothetical protein IP92_01458 [Pseudoduganella flava]